MNMLRLICNLGLGGLIRKIYVPKNIQPVMVSGLSFKNKIGLGAGFDKNAKYLRELECLGFGFVEIGTVTPLPQKGNDKPRLFRLPADKALINRMGFNNDGIDLIVERLKRWNEKNGKRPGKDKMLIGGNIGKNKITENDNAWMDYEQCFEKLHPYVDYFVVNVSSPNTPGLRELQEKQSLRKILTQLQLVNATKEKMKPIFLKIAPDLTPEQVNEVVDLAKEIRLEGLVVSNTTISREHLKTNKEKILAIGNGGLSGLPLQEKSTALVRHIHNRAGENLSIIGSGGIFNASDAREKFAAGAKLVQVWTGFIYEGPGIVKNICKHLENQNE
jgi:dihydroorotate dehydrogenase